MDNNSSNRSDNPQTADWMRGDSLSTIREPEGSILGSLVDGRYLIKQKLGHGGFGVVYLALDKKMVSRPVVVKVILEQGSGDEWSVRKFQQEIEALARVDHPSIVGIFDAGEMPDGKPYLVMQYVEGISLRAAIKPEGMEFDRAANIIRQVGRALSAAHRKDIFHRDLKPENVMLRSTSDGDEQVKVIDFGVAKVRNSVTSLSTGKERAVGTIAYMSPEQLTVCKLTAASDVYSFGVMAYEMLTGRRPNNPESMFQLLEMQRAGARVKPMDLRPGIPLAAQNSIMKALSFEPEARQQKAREFGDELSWALIEDPDRTRPPSSVYFDSQPISSHAKSATSDAGQANVPTIVGDIPTQVSPVVSTKSKRRALVYGGMTGLALILAALVGGGVWYAVANRTTATPPVTNKVVDAAGSEQSFSYWLRVQKIQNHKPIGEPFDSEGQIAYGNGWGFSFNVQPAQSGALYLVNEGPGPGGKTQFNVLFPTPKNGGAQLAANQKAQTETNYFDEFKGTERLWIIWSAQPLANLDKVFSDAAKTKGVIEDESEIGILKEYLKLWETKPPTVLPLKVRKLTIVTGKNNILVSLVELAHEDY
jgi:serine/threonine-protein kinase